MGDGLPAPLAATLLALADDEFVIGHRHSEWLGLSPFLEEDLTVSSIAQDELGHARSLYALVWPDTADREASLVQRPALEWRSCALVERRGQPWEVSLMRHWAYDHIEQFRWRALLTCGVPLVAALGERVLIEERFHVGHADALVRRLTSVADAQARLQTALDAIAEDALSLAAEVGESVVRALSELASGVGLSLIPRIPSTPDRTIRHPDAAEIWSQLTAVMAFDPSASW
jgi:ring-1,2-phenylacetyl-CoA epoxidase subunit PaaC